MSFISGGKPGRGGAKDPGASGSKRAPKKYCSILTYVQYNNRELYDAINDICAVGMFSMRSHGHGPDKTRAALTFLMPSKSSEMHDAIIKAAYGSNPMDALHMLKSCLLQRHIKSLDELKQGDLIPTAARADVLIESAGATAKIGGAHIIVDENFDTLYTDAAFHVYILESGMLATTNASSGSSAGVSGGAWQELREEKDANLKTPAGLAVSAINAHLVHLKAAQSTSSALPGWIAGNPNNVFHKWGVSLAHYCREKSPKDFELVKRLYHPNPMCVIPFSALFLDRSTFNDWLAHEDAPGMEYSYAEYQKFVPAAPEMPADKAHSVMLAAVQSVRDKKRMDETASIVRSGYESAYSGSDLKWSTKLLYDEAVFVMNSYVRAAAAGDLAKCKCLGDILVGHYTNKNDSSVLAAVGDSRCEIQSGAMHCKLLEFALSESFMYPNGYCQSHNRPAGLRETAEEGAELLKIPVVCVDFSDQIRAFFSRG